MLCSDQCYASIDDEAPRSARSARSGDELEMRLMRQKDERARVHIYISTHRCGVVPGLKQPGTRPNSENLTEQRQDKREGGEPGRGQDSLRYQVTPGTSMRWGMPFLGDTVLQTPLFQCGTGGD